MTMTSPTDPRPYSEQASQPTSAAPRTTVRAATEADIEAAAQILLDAFAQDPWTLGHIPAAAIGSPEAAQYQQRALREHGLAHQNIDVVVVTTGEGTGDDDGRIVGVAQWSPPLAPEQSQELEVLFVSTHQLDAEQVAADHELVVAARPPEPHWHLEMLAVSPAAQGLGAGTQLLRHGLQRAAGTSVALESTTPASRRLYERHGFTLHQEVVDSRAVTQYAMWLRA